MNIACYDCRQILKGKSAKGIFGNHKIVCPKCGGENIKEVRPNETEQGLQENHGGRGVPV